MKAMHHGITPARQRCAAFCAVLAMCLAGPGHASTYCEAPLSGAEIVPAPVNTVSTGTMQSMDGDCIGGSLGYLSIVHNVANAIAVEIRVGGPGENGPLVVSQPAGEGGAFFTPQTQGVCPLPLTGPYYMVVTSAAYPDGEIRAQLCGFVSCNPQCAQPWDANEDHVLDLSELLRVIQLYNSGGYHCAADPDILEDGYAPGPGADQTCEPHAADRNPQDWRIGLSELLRLIQFYNAGGYHYCPLDGTEDGYCPGP